MAKDKLISRYKDKFPEKDYDTDPDAIYGDIDSEITELNSYKEKNSATNEKLIGVLRSHPEVAKFVRDLAKGAPLAEAVARNFGDITPAEGEPDYEAWGNGLSERQKSLKEKDDYAASFDTNVEVSDKTFKEFVAKNKISEEKAEELVEMVDMVMRDGIDGKIEEKTLSALYTAITHDEVVGDKVTQATTKAKNEKIVAQMEGDKAKKAGDGLPDVAGAGKVLPAAEEEKVDDSLDGFGAGFDAEKKRRKF